MINKTANFLIVIVGLLFFFFSSWIVDNLMITNLKLCATFSCAITIIGAMFILIGIINFTTLIFSNGFEENKTRINQITFPSGKKFQ